MSASFDSSVKILITTQVLYAIQILAKKLISVPLTVLPLFRNPNKIFMGLENVDLKPHPKTEGNLETRSSKSWYKWIEHESKKRRLIFLWKTRELVQCTKIHVNTQWWEQMVQM